MPESRTKKATQLEKEFQPFFDFLAKEEKDLTTLHKYSIHLPSQNLTLEKSDGGLEGEYRGGGDGSSQVSLTPEGTLDYFNKPDEPFDDKWFTPVLTQEFFKSLPISGENPLEHAEYEHSIEYNASKKESDFLNQVRQEYDLSPKSQTHILLVKSKYETTEAIFYTLAIFLKDGDRKVQITYKVGLPIEE